VDRAAVAAAALSVTSVDDQVTLLVTAWTVSRAAVVATQTTAAGNT